MFGVSSYSWVGELQAYANANAKRLGEGVIRPESWARSGSKVR